MQTQARLAKANRYHVESCAICLETLADTPAMPQRLLGCGHTFHAECINGWTKVKSTCAICREPDAEAAGMPAAPERAVRDERTFRLQRSRDLYPDFVTEMLRERWTRSDDSAFASAETD